MDKWKVILASQNAGKIREFQVLCDKVAILLLPQSTLHIEDVEETGLTFVENALLKARHASCSSGLPAISDDSGLVVPALSGAPGIYSKRYAGLTATSADNNQQLLANMADLPDDQRHAYFYCVLIYLSHAEDPTPLICEGQWHGKILSKPQGNNGFGYDPLFYDPAKQKSAAEMSMDEKNQLSHRGKALQLLTQRLSEKITL